MSRMPPPTDTLLAVWARTLAAAPSAVALIDDAAARRWTRAEIEAEAGAWAAEHDGDVRGQTVAFAEPNGAGWLRVLLGLAKCDAVAAPLDPGEPPLAQLAAARGIGATCWWHEGKLERLGPPARPRRDGRRFVKLTSGSTGAPRALLFTDAELLADARQICAAMRVRPEDVNVGLIPWGHSYGIGNLVMPLLLQGSAILFGAAPLPHAMAAAIARWRPDVFPAVPALLRALAGSAIAPAELASLRTVISAGAPLAPEVARAFRDRFDLKIHSFYGSSETGGITYDGTGDSAAEPRGLGWPLPGVQLDFGRGGRFTVRSAAVFTIGNRHPGAHRMPDIGRLDPAGELVLLGRAGRFVKIGGRRLNLAEVEQAIRQVPGVRDALVAPQMQRSEALAAAVATDLTPAQLRDALRPRLAPWKIPKKWVVMADFPTTARGKPDARRIRDLLAASETPGADTP